MKKKSKVQKPDLREIHIERKTSDNGKRRFMLMSEIIEKDGYLARAQKKYSYYVCERTDKKFADQTKLKSWAQSQDKVLKQKPHKVSIRRSFDQETGIGQTLSRTTGSFYVVRNQRIFAIAFLHSVKFDILGHIAT